MQKHKDKVKLRLLILASVVLLASGSPMCLGQDTRPSKEVSSGWVWFEINDVETIGNGKPIFCGKESAIIPLKSSIRVIDLKRQQSTYIPAPAGKSIWDARCSKDGNYVFVASFDGSVDLSYLDLRTGEEHNLFSDLTEIDATRIPLNQLVSPNTDQVIGPEELGPTVSLANGKVLTVIPASYFKDVGAQCGIRWSSDGLKLFYFSQSEPKMINGKNEWQVTVRTFDISNRTWSEATTDYLNIGPFNVGCPTGYMYQDRIFYKFETLRYAPTGIHDVYEFIRDGNKLRVSKSWQDISDFSIGRDGTVAYSRLHGIRYFYDGYELTSGGNVKFEVLVERNSHQTSLTKSTIYDVKDISGISFAIGQLNIGVVIDSIDGPVAVLNEFQPDFEYEAEFYRQDTY